MSLAGCKKWFTSDWPFFCGHKINFLEELCSISEHHAVIPCFFWYKKKRDVFGENDATCKREALGSKLNCVIAALTRRSHTEEDAAVAAGTLTELLTFHNATILNVHRGVPACACEAGEGRTRGRKRR